MAQPTTGRQNAAPRRLALALMGAFLLLPAGCAYIRTSSSAEVAALPDPDDMVAVPEKAPKSTVSPEDVAKRVDRLVAETEDRLEQEQIEKAAAAYRKALALLLAHRDEAKGETAVRFDRLLLRANLAGVRIARLSGVLLAGETRVNEMGLAFNKEVERWLTYYLTSGRGSMTKFLERMGAYEDMIDAVLAEKNLPADIKYLPIIESGFSPYAYSPAAAVGLWQFIPGTGKRFGLTINEWVDERRDPVKSTYAAAAYLETLHGMFGDWSLALASYNCGEDRVSGACRVAGTKNFWELSLPSETTDYVPKFYAAMMIAREPELYGFYVEPEPPIQVERIRLDGVVGLRAFAELTTVDYEELKALNPELLGAYTPPTAIPYEINVPASRADAVRVALAETAPEKVYLSKAEITKLQKPQARGGSVTYYRVKKATPCRPLRENTGRPSRRFSASIRASARRTSSAPARSFGFSAARGAKGLSTKTIWTRSGRPGRSA
ncbi:MAG: lytic transglycosylase domain-containing protein [Deltaproteobacteria bacterium]|nr:lytic transglycosylase domain-containing protein [Deltaproteobacteria bacterium]